MNLISIHLTYSPDLICGSESDDKSDHVTRDGHGDGYDNGVGSGYGDGAGSGEGGGYSFGW